MAAKQKPIKNDRVERAITLVRNINTKLETISKYNHRRFVEQIRNFREKMQSFGIR